MSIKRMPIDMDSGRPQFINTRNPNISKRLQRIVDKSIELRYTTDDLKLLYNMLRFTYLSDRIHIGFCLHDYLNNSLRIDENVEESYPLTMWEYYPVSRDINLSHYLLLFYRKVFLFMTCVPLTSVPKYIGTEMETYAEWRLQINK